MSLLIPLLYLVFFLSGAAGLFYESVWTRYLGLLVGHDAHAQVIVLVIFLGGMSIGAAVVARRTVGIVNPLRSYAIVEAVAGVAGLLFHDLFVAASGMAYGSLFPALANTAALAPAKWALAGALILPQSILLGTTFPLMSAAVLRAAPSRPGNVLSWLYFTNSLGGAIGVLVAGFLLVRIAGLPGVLAAAAVLNLVVALVAFVLSKRLPHEAVVVPVEAPLAGPHPLPPPIPLPRLQRLLLGVAFGTAVASFAYEIDWIRMLALVLGSATHAFELMLSAFILGLAIGAISIRKLDAHRSPLHTLGTVQVAMGLLAVFTLPVYVASFEWFTTIMAMVSRTDAGYTSFSVLRYGLCLLVMLPSTICAGMTLPLITRSLMVGGGGESAIGKVYAWNTLGAIVGVALAALVLLPGLGLKPMLLLAGGLDIALGLLVFRLLAARRRVAIGAALGALTIGSIALTVPLDRALLTSGVFRSGSLARITGAKVVYYADGRTATVAVGEGQTGSRWISTNGKSDASLGPWWQEACSDTTSRRLGGDELTQTLLPLVTAAYHPAPRTAAVIGFGSGMSSHLLLGIPTFTSVTTIEIEPKMIEGARAFLPANSRVYEDPRSHLVIGDAKAHFAAAAERWDVILSEPSNPWVSGVSGLFTTEFYVRVSAALADGGVFGQWLHTYELSDELVLSVLAAIDAVFPSWRIHQVGSGDLLVIASAEPQLPVMNAEAVLRAPGVAADLCRFVTISGIDFEALVLAEPALLRPVLTAIGQPNSDFYPTLDLGAEQTRFRGSTARGMLTLGTDWRSAAQALVGSPDRLIGAEVLPMDGIGRVTEAWVAGNFATAKPSSDARLVRAQWTMQQWEALRDAASAPINWTGWLDAMGSAMRVVHGGRAGVADSGFFEAAGAAAVRFRAPEDVQAVIALRSAVAGWDAPSTLGLAARIEADSAIGRLISAAELLDGVVPMALRAGDKAAADKWLTLLAPRVGRSPDDLRMLLLAAWVGVDR